MSTAEKPLRKDAERNRQLILDAAREAFAEEGLDVGFHEIARRAGVGVGTVYRRFEDKDQLVEALFLDRVDEVVAIAEEALAEEDAFGGLESFLRGTLALQHANRGLHELVFTSASGTRCASRGRERIAPLVAQLVARAQEQGTLRADVAVFDVGMTRQLLGKLADQTDDPELVGRLLGLFLDGLRTRRAEPTPLPGSPPTPEEFERILAQR